MDTFRCMTESIKKVRFFFRILSKIFPGGVDTRTWRMHYLGMGRIHMSSFDWLSTENAFRAIEEIGASLYRAANDAAEAAKESSETASEALVSDISAAPPAVKTESCDQWEAEEEASCEKSEKISAKPIDPGALSTAQKTVSAVVAIAQAISKIDDIKKLSSVSLTELFGGAFVEQKDKKTSELSLVSSDKKVRVEQLSDASLASLFEKGFQNFDMQTGKIDMPNIFDQLSSGDAPLPSAKAKQPTDATKPRAGEAPDACMAALKKDTIEALTEDIVYVDDLGRRTVITGEQGNVRVITTDASGKVLSEISKTSNQTDVVCNGEHACRRPDGSMEFKGKGFKVIVKDGVRHVYLDDNRELVREGEGARIIDHKTNQVFEIDKHQFKHVLETGIGLTIARESDDLDKLTRAIQRDLKPDGVALLVIKGVGVRTIFGDGVIMDVRNDKTARIQTKDGHVFMMDEKGKLFLVEGNQNKPLDENNLPENIKFRNGKFYVGDFELNPTEVRIIAQRMAQNSSAQVTMVDLRRGRTTYQVGGKETLVDNHADGSTTVLDGTTSIANNGTDGHVVVQDTKDPEKKFEIDLETHSIETEHFTDTRQGLIAKATGTSIDRNGDVRFGGGGPVLFNDGSVKVDERTTIGANGSVHCNAAAECKAASVADGGASKAADVYGKALGGIVRSADVAALNGALGDVVGLMGTVLPGSIAYARLMVSYNQICNAINFATPKAHAAEVAISRGVSDETSLKHVEDNIMAATAEQAVEREQLSRKEPGSVVEFVPKGYWLEIKTAS